MSSKFGVLLFPQNLTYVSLRLTYVVGYVVNVQNVIHISYSNNSSRVTISTLKIDHVNIRLMITDLPTLF